MTIKNAIDELIKVRSQKQQAIKAFENSSVDINKNELEIARYIVKRLDCIIEDLTNYMMSPSIAESFELDENISKQIENKSSVHAIVDRQWVATLDYSLLSLFRYNGCKEYYAEHKKSCDKIINEDTWSKGITIVTAVITIILLIIAISLYSYGIGITNDGGFNYDMWAFITATIGAVVIIIGWIGGLIYNCRTRKKYDNAPYSIEELRTIKYEDNPKKRRLESPFDYNKQVTPPIIYQVADKIENNFY